MDLLRISFFPAILVRPVVRRPVKIAGKPRKNNPIKKPWKKSTVFCRKKKPRTPLKKDRPRIKPADFPGGYNSIK